MITFITGGARSGKSRYGLDLAGRYARPAFVATAEAFDEELRERIRRHREEREARYFTIEEPLDLAAALRRLPPETEIAIVDCLTVWLGNLLHHGQTENVDSFLAVLADPPCPLVLISNEVGMGGIAMSPLGREFADRLGRLNQQVAARADRAVLIVSGLPLFLKGGPG
ncbi:MAG TPA: bifunctional adenosylcobinamide kinase/adenosylcobinamide-phosphate guanylyltransferase [Thermoanaerobaculia bacterium]|nr:bifunctional adenosylcobinamide kinase/adenosylcobinamide-phosphate guanylyltransferase [Thermoanaerobaculia bacterium]